MEKNDQGTGGSASNKLEGAVIKENKVLMIALGALGFLAVLALIFFIYLYIQEKQKTIDALNSRIGQMENEGAAGGNAGGDDVWDFFFGGTAPPGSSGDQPGGLKPDLPPLEDEVADPYEGWKTYTNRDIGYKLKYPADWQVKEVEQFSDLIQQNVKYITVKSPNDKYYLYWGLKKINDNFAISDRSGVGAGDIVEDGHVTILDSVVPVKRLEFAGKTKECFYPGMGSAKIMNGQYLYGASFGGGSGVNYDSVNVANTNELVLAGKILESVKLIDRNGELCQSTLANLERTLIRDWTNYHSQKYGFLFSHPSAWIQRKGLIKLEDGQKEEDIAAFTGNNDDEKFMWLSGQSAMEKLPQLWVMEKTGETKVACENATYRQYRRQNKMVLMTQFEIDGIKHSVLFGFTEIGANITADLIRQYELLMKTIQFDE